jgi:hypothetical protein
MRIAFYSARRAACTESPSLAVRVGVLLGRLSDRLEQPRISDPRLLVILADDFDPELPVVSIVEKECHFGADRWEGIDDPGPLHTASPALSHVSE